MAHTLVKIIRNEDGDLQENPKWHLSKFYGDSPRTICKGECYGIGEGSAEYKEKTVEKGGITCQDCLYIIKDIKAVKL